MTIRSTNGVTHKDRTFNVEFRDVNDRPLVTAAASATQLWRTITFDTAANLPVGQTQYQDKWLIDIADEDGDGVGSLTLAIQAGRFALDGLESDWAFSTTDRAKGLLEGAKGSLTATGLGTNRLILVGRISDLKSAIKALKAHDTGVGSIYVGFQDFGNLDSGEIAASERFEATPLVGGYNIAPTLLVDRVTFSQSSFDAPSANVNGVEVGSLFEIGAVDGMSNVYDSLDRTGPIGLA